MSDLLTYFAGAVTVIVPAAIGGWWQSREAGKARRDARQDNDRARHAAYREDLSARMLADLDEVLTMRAETWAALDRWEEAVRLSNTRPTPTDVVVQASRMNAAIARLIGAETGDLRHHGGEIQRSASACRASIFSDHVLLPGRSGDTGSSGDAVIEPFVSEVISQAAEARTMPYPADWLENHYSVLMRLWRQDHKAPAPAWRHPIGALAHRRESRQHERSIRDAI